MLGRHIIKEETSNFINGRKSFCKRCLHCLTPRLQQRPWGDLSGLFPWQPVLVFWLINTNTRVIFWEMEPGNHFWGQPSRRNELLAVVLWTPGFYTHPHTHHCLLPYWTLLLTQLTGWGRTGCWRRGKERSGSRVFIWLSGVLKEQFVSILNVALKFWGKKYFKICFYFYFFFN